MKISSDLINLIEIAMSAFIDYVRNYRKVYEHCGSVSNWPIVGMIFGLCILTLILLFIFRNIFIIK